MVQTRNAWRPTGDVTIGRIAVLHGPSREGPEVWSQAAIPLEAEVRIAARAVFGAVVDPSSAYETAGGAVGTLLSAGFLYLIAVLNLIVLAGIFKVFRDMRRHL